MWGMGGRRSDEPEKLREKATKRATLGRREGEQLQGKTQIENDAAAARRTQHPQWLGLFTQEASVPATLGTVAKMCPLTDEWIKKMWYVYTMEY